jgi:hypothetical protein
MGKCDSFGKMQVPGSNLGASGELMGAKDRLGLTDLCLGDMPERSGILKAVGEPSICGRQSHILCGEGTRQWCSLQGCSHEVERKERGSGEIGLDCLGVDCHDPFADVFKESDPTLLKLSMS